MHRLSRDVCMSSRTCIHYLNWSPDHWTFLEVDFLWAPLVRSERILKCRHCLPGSETRFSTKAYIYSLTNNKGSGHAEYNPVKVGVKRVELGHFAVRTSDSYGPSFGANDILISNNASSNTDSLTKCGTIYVLPPGYSLAGSKCKFYAGSYKFTPTDIEVFYETTT